MYDTLFDEVYDTNGENFPFYDAFQDEAATGYDFEYNPVPKKKELDSPDTVYYFTATPTHDTYIGDAYYGTGNIMDISSNEINKMKVKYLMEGTKKNWFGTKCKKAELVAHIQKVMDDKVVVVDANQPISRHKKQKNDNLTSGFPDFPY